MTVTSSRGGPGPVPPGGRPRVAAARSPPEASGGVGRSGGGSRGPRKGWTAPERSGTGSGEVTGHVRRAGDPPSVTEPGVGAERGGGLSSSQGQVDVRSMIARLNRDRSPVKRRREDNDSTQSATSSEEDDPTGEEGEQLAPIMRLLQREMRKQTTRLAEHFQRAHQTLKEELQCMQQRIGDLEQHVSDQGDTIMQLHNAVDSRDQRIWELEGEVEELRRISNVPFLVLDGPGVPAPPRDEPWREDVMATTKGVLSKYMPTAEVRDTDIVQCYRADRGKKLVCQFSRVGPGSVRDTIYDNRMAMAKDENGQMRSSSEQLYVNEKLTPGALGALMRLRAAKRNGQLYSVHTKYGYIYVRMFRHGARLRVSNRAECERVLSGEI